MRTKDIMSDGKKVTTTDMGCNYLEIEIKQLDNMNFAIIGATGNVGRKTIEVLEKSKIEIDNLFLVASKKMPDRN